MLLKKSDGLRTLEVLAGSLGASAIFLDVFVLQVFEEDHLFAASPTSKARVYL